MLYERKAQSYSKEEMEELVKRLEGAERRGSNTLYWEDVEVGDKLGPLVLPPWTLQDQVCQDTVNSQTVGTGDNPGDVPIKEKDVLSFESAYRRMREKAWQCADSSQHPLALDSGSRA